MSKTASTVARSFTVQCTITHALYYFLSLQVNFEVCVTKIATSKKNYYLTNANTPINANFLSFMSGCRVSQPKLVSYT